MLVPVAGFNLWFGSHFGILVTELQPMKISAAEAQWDTCQPCAMSLVQVGGFTENDQTDFLDRDSARAFVGRDRVARRPGSGSHELNQQYEAMFGPGNYMPPVRTIYWSMRVMVYAGSLVAPRRRPAHSCLETPARAVEVVPRLAVFTSFLPFVAMTAGWMLTEIGRQPWIVQGLLKTGDANSPAVSSTMLVFSLAVFVGLYLLLIVLDIWLMRRYAKLDPPELDRDETGEPMPAIGY